MIRHTCGLVALALSALSAQAAQAQTAGAELNDSQRLGRALFNQSCRVCHTPPSLNAPLYGPALTQDTQRGKDDVVAEIIREGSPRMPGFKYQFGADEIGAIVGYLRTVPAQPAVSPMPSQQPVSPPAPRGERERRQREAD
jgi:mono/diheme cytochrome c family protein